MPRGARAVSDSDCLHGRPVLTAGASPPPRAVLLCPTGTELGTGYGEAHTEGRQGMSWDYRGWECGERQRTEGTVAARDEVNTEVVIRDEKDIAQRCL